VAKPNPLATDLSRALNPPGLMAELGMQPDRWQEDLLRELPRRALLNCCRQSGKSTTAAVFALHAAMFAPKQLILLLSPSLRQSAELFRKVAQFYHLLSDVERPVQESVLRLELPNHSRIISLPGSEATIRGYSSANVIVVDEASRVPDEMMAAIRPMLATTDGCLILMSTPWGKRGFFWKAWAFDSGWKKFQLSASECLRISPAFLAEEERTLGPLIFQQEYQCEFVDDDSAVFTSALIEQALTDEVEPLWPQKSEQ
jgi:terminase large subunit-like protein